MASNATGRGICVHVRSRVLWAKDYTENWSAFAQDFKELEENEEYVGREDEFDIVPEADKVRYTSFRHAWRPRVKKNPMPRRSKPVAALTKPFPGKESDENAQEQYIN